MVIKNEFSFQLNIGKFENRYAISIALHICVWSSKTYSGFLFQYETHLLRSLKGSYPWPWKNISAFYYDPGFVIQYGAIVYIMLLIHVYSIQSLEISEISDPFKLLTIIHCKLIHILTVKQF